MGIRIHKAMGYGLTDVAEVEGTDPRLNWGSPLFRCGMDGHDRVDEYHAWLADRGRSDVAKSMDKAAPPGTWKRAFDIQDCFYWGNSDYGMKNVFMIRPLAWQDWYRSDDSIDWVEQTESPEGQRDTVQVLRHGIYPHTSYMDDRSGERLMGNEAHAWHRARHAVEEGRWSGDSGEEALETLATMMGFESHAEALEHCVPHVPDEVRWLAEFTEAFTVSDVELRLRPMVYTYWG
jgi:hypothetical protein